MTLTLKSQEITRLGLPLESDGAFGLAQLTAEYEFYGGIKGASTNSIADEDRFALQLTTQF